MCLVLQQLDGGGVDTQRRASPPQKRRGTENGEWGEGGGRGAAEGLEGSHYVDCLGSHDGNGA